MFGKVVMTFIREENVQYGESRIDQDGLWKKVIGDLFEDFLLFFNPKLHQLINFSQEPDFLDKELFQEVVDEQKGKRYADRLAKVRLKNGEEKWILIHIEVQGKNETEFPERMFQYFYRIYDRHQEKIVAMAVHTSPNKSEMLEQFKYDYFGTRLYYSYNNYRIEEYSDVELERSDNIFSKVVLAAKAMHKTRDEDHQRYLFKRKLMREVVRNQNYSRTKVQAVLHFIDYLLRLPETYMKQLSEEIGPMIREEKGLMELYNKENASPTVIHSFREELERGIEQSVQLEKKNIAKKLILQNMPLETIVEVTGLSLEEITLIQKSIR